jgi:Dolichyl-phosphate-mannose-protein mannosyltransferase
MRYHYIVRSPTKPTKTLTIVSVKWIGLFVTALVGVYTIEDLWDKFGDLRMPVVSTTPSYPAIYLLIDLTCT